MSPESAPKSESLSAEQRAVLEQQKAALEARITELALVRQRIIEYYNKSTAANAEQNKSLQEQLAEAKKKLGQ